MSAELTLGAEEELHLIDLDSWTLSARAPQLLSQLPAEHYSAELQRTTVETNTAVVSTLSDLRREIARLRDGLIAVAADAGLGVAAVGTAPRSTFSDFELTAAGRYSRMQEQYRLLVDEQLICGTQIHVGVSDRDLAVRIAQRVSRELPTLLALSASSPFWNGLDTGYASIRTIIWQRWPSAGATGPLETAQQYDTLLADLIATGVIADAKMAYFDVRPSAHEPTLELRVCDACPIIDDTVLIAGLFRAAVRAAELEIEAGAPYAAPAAPIHRAAMWQAARSGLSGNLVDQSGSPRPVPAPVAVRELVTRLRPHLEELGDYDDVRELSEDALTRGNSADRQRVAFAERGDLDDVTRLVVRETHGTVAKFLPDVEPLRGYRARAGDEAVGIGARPRPPYRDVLHFFDSLPPDQLATRQDARTRWTSERGMTFGVGGESRNFEVDLLPRIISSYEWTALSAGLIQRARAIESFLRDIYTEQRVLQEGLFPREWVQHSPGWRVEATRLPPGTPRAPIMGFDLVRNETGGWRVLEDNVRNPSGVAYAIAARELIDAVVPALPRPPRLLDPHTAHAALRRTLQAPGRDGAASALLSSGPGSSAWFEHRRLAEGAGLHLIGADDITAERDRVVLRNDGTPVGCLYLRLDGEVVDLEDSSGYAIGADIMAVATAGGVVLANAPGNGIADDKAMYCHIPELIQYYLGEHPLLESVPTYRAADEGERRIVLERVGELVTKPVDGHGGRGILIGPAASAASVAARRAVIAANPAEWVAQELVALSSLPSFAGMRLEPRRVDLRVFAYATGTDPGDYAIADVALTRVAQAGSFIVNSSRGGGAKDTWIIGDTATSEDGNADVRTRG